MTKLLQPRFSRYENPTNDHWDGEEGDDSIESLDIEHNVADRALYVGVEGEVAIDDGGNDHQKVKHDKDIQHNEAVMKGLGPACIGMTSSHYPLSEQDVDDEEQDDSSGNEDTGRDS